MRTREYHVWLRFLVGLVFLAGMFSACTVEKRKYREGFHVEWRKKKNQSSKEEMCEKDLSPALANEREVPKPSAADSVTEFPASSETAQQIYSEPMLEATLDNEWPIVLSTDTITPDEYYSNEKPIEKGINETAVQSKKLGLWAILVLLSVFVIPIITAFIPILSATTAAYPLIGMGLSFFCAWLAVKKGKEARKEFADFPNRYTNDRDFRKGIRRGRIILGFFIALGVLAALLLIFLLLYLGTLI
jgi:hypothetical protein